MINLNLDPDERQRREQERKKAEADLLRQKNVWVKLAGGICSENADAPNQKIELLGALFELEDWHHVGILYARLIKVVPAGNERISASLCKLLHTAIEKAYSNIAGSFRLLKRKPDRASVLSSSSTADVEMTTADQKTTSVSGSSTADVIMNGTHGHTTPLNDTKTKPNVFETLLATDVTIENFCAVVEPVAKLLSIYLYRDVVLFAKICRILAVIVQNLRQQHEAELQEVTKERQSVPKDPTLPPIHSLADHQPTFPFPLEVV